MARWILDPDHSVAAFTAIHFMATTVRGQFNQVSGEVLFDPADPTATRFQVEIRTAGLYTGVGRRDQHLLSTDFLLAAEFPTITFVSAGVELVRSNALKVTGALTLRGQTRRLDVDAQFLGPVTGPEELGGETTMTFCLAGRLNRQEFGLNWNRPMANNKGVVVSREIAVFLDLEADLHEG